MVLIQTNAKMYRKNNNMCHEIITNLYLGNKEATKFSEVMGIDYIISIGAQPKNKTIENFHIGIKDDNTLNISDELDTITSLMDELLTKNKKIMIHCNAGRNRSPSFVLAYICKYKNMELEEAVNYILSKRKICSFSFKNNVKEWLDEANIE